MTRCAILILTLLILTSCITNSEDCDNFSKRNGRIKMKTIYKTTQIFHVKNCMYHGEFREYFDNHQLKKKGNFKNGYKVSEWYYYDVNGNLDSIELYENGVRIKR